MTGFSKISSLFLLYLILILFSSEIINSQIVSDFRVNDDSTNQSQYAAKVGTDSIGNFTIVWYDAGSGNDPSIRGQIFDKNSNKIGKSFQINNDQYQALPSLYVRKNGSFIVVWSVIQTKFKIFNKFGEPISNEIIIGDSSGSISSVSGDSYDNFVIAWEQYDALLNKQIYCQLIDSAGKVKGNKIKVNDDSGNYTHKNPDITVRNDGSFIITWNDTRPPGMVHADDIYMQMYDKSGNTVGVNQKVNDDLANTNQQIAPKISSDSLGNFVIAWSDGRLNNSHGEVFAQMYNISGTKIGQNFRVTNSSLQFGKGVGGVSMKPNGDFVIGWSEFRPNIPQCYFQRYNNTGSQIGINYLVSDQSLNTDKYFSDLKIYDDKIISIWSDRRNGPFDVYCNIRSFTNPDTTVNIIQTSSLIPENFYLYQNYPNPFNNSTQFRFDISQNNNYKLEIYNNLGQKIKEVFNKFLTTGSYNINFESGNISSGVYQYILSSPKERYVKSFVLLK